MSSRRSPSSFSFLKTWLSTPESRKRSSWPAFGLACLGYLRRSALRTRGVRMGDVASAGALRRTWWPLSRLSRYSFLAAMTPPCLRCWRFAPSARLRLWLALGVSRGFSGPEGMSASVMGRCVKLPRSILPLVTCFCPWSAEALPHHTVRGSGEPIFRA